jgi:hypothetical protein
MGMMVSWRMASTNEDGKNNDLEEDGIDNNEIEDNDF